MADLVGDVPAGRGRRRAPAGLVEAGHQGAGDGRLGGEVSGQRGHVYRHVVIYSSAARTARTWPVLTCSPALARSSATTPLAGALTVCSIFIASRTRSG